MHFSRYPLENEMRSNVSRGNPGASRAATLDDATTLRISGSYVDHLPNAFDMNNNQNQAMYRYPVYSAVEGGPICDLLASSHISTHRVTDGVGEVTQAAYLLDVGTESQEQFEQGTELSCLLASRACAYDNVDDQDPAALYGSFNSRTLRYEDGSFTRTYDNQMQGSMADVWVQPCSIIYGSPIDSNQYNMTSYPYGSAFFSNELSLSLATTSQARCSELSCSGVTIHHDSGRCSEQSSSAKNNNECYLNCRASQPSQAPSGSSYLWAVQQILADLATFSLENLNLGSYPSCSPGHVGSISGAFSDSEGSESSAAAGTLSLNRHDVNSTKKQLKVLLKMLDEGYGRCLREVSGIMSAFHPVTGLDPELHLGFLLQTTSFLFNNVKERISAQIVNIKAQEKSFESSFIHKQWALQQLRRKEHQLWRPQRGLPEQSVSVLRAWMFQNFLHPYPKDSEKQMLAIKSGLTRSQVSNWFINARVRLWKPMIEEMYAEISKRKAQRKDPANENSERGHLSIGNQRFKWD